MTGTMLAVAQDRAGFPSPTAASSLRLCLWDGVTSRYLLALKGVVTA